MSNGNCPYTFFFQIAKKGIPIQGWWKWVCSSVFYICKRHWCVGCATRFELLPPPLLFIQADNISKVIKNEKKWAQNYGLNVNVTSLLCINCWSYCILFLLQQNFSSDQFQELQWIDIWFLNAAGLINKLRNIFPPENIRALTRSNLILISYWKVIITSWHKSVLQGHRTQIDTFQTHNFSWFNDILCSQKPMIFIILRMNVHFIHLTWPSQPFITINMGAKN